MRPITRHLLILGSILVATLLLYSRISGSYFCGYDDFIEIHRAAFEDRAEPMKILTTSHYNSFKYRPLSRALNLAAYLAGGQAAPFRIRNLFFHFVSIVSIYCLSWLLFQSPSAAAGAALLFGIHPLANQSVSAAVFTNTAANALFLLALALFVWSAKNGRIALLLLSLFCGTASLYTYESGVVLVGVMAAWLALGYFFTGERPRPAFLLVFVVLGGILFGSYLVARRSFVPANTVPISSPATVVKNSILYSGAILVSIDSVLANEWLGTPLPPEMMRNGPGAVWIALGCGAAGLMALLLFLCRRQFAGWVKLESRQIIFALVGAILCLLPFLLFTSHPSETYSYLPVAFYCLLLSRLLSIVPSYSGSAALLAVFVILFASATWIRNQRVARCAATAQSILSNLPLPEWKQGSWHILLARAPGEPLAVRFGFYNYFGLDTLGTGEEGTGEYGLRAVQLALQMANGNTQLTADALPAGELASRCGSPGPREACYWVHRDGLVTIFGKPFFGK